MIDVFSGAEHPGPEIVTYFVYSACSQGALRIYNLAGDCLFHVWIDGMISDVRWLADAGILICAASKGDRDATEYGVSPGASRLSNHPHVLFAIRPRAGEISKGWIHPHPPGDPPRFTEDAWKGEWYRPVWYKALCPVAFAFDVVLDLFEAWLDEYQSSTHFQLRVRFPGHKLESNRDYAISADFDQFGKMVSDPLLTDFSRRARENDATLPDPGMLQLVDWSTGDLPCLSSGR